MEPLDSFKTGPPIPISRELLDDYPDLTGQINRMMYEQLTYGRSMKHPNWFPEYVFFPRTQRVIDVVLRFKGRCDDAVSAFRYGMPPDTDDH